MGCSTIDFEFDYLKHGVVLIGAKGFNVGR
jgi:hypothetical protein